MFTTPCFIRKNTPEFRKRLEELGYKPSYPICQHPEVFKHIAVCNFFGSKYYGVSDDEVSHHGEIKDAIKNRGMIDCGTNEDLFLALAALRDDTDKYQWFIYNSMDCTVEKLRNFYWFKCEEDKIEDMMYWDCMYLNCTKATVKEIIEHFKNPICQEIGD